MMQAKSGTHIVLIPWGGLCNRMRAIACGLNLAKRTNGTMKIFWPVLEELGAPFEEVFRPIPRDLFPFSVKVKSIGVNKINGYLWTKQKSTVIRLLGLAGWRWLLDFKRVDLEKIGVGSFLGQKSVVESCYAFLPHEEGDVDIGKMFPLRQEIVARGEQLANADMVGIHIRRSDNAWSTQGSPLVLFKKTIAEKIAMNPKQRFYLATDDDETAKELKTEFGDAIVLQEHRRLSRGDRGGIIDAAVDFYALSRCGSIFGSYWSSFSDIAAEYGNCPLTILKEESYRAEEN